MSIGRESEPRASISRRTRDLHRTLIPRFGMLWPPWVITTAFCYHPTSFRCGLNLLKRTTTDPSLELSAPIWPTSPFLASGEMGDCQVAGTTRHWLTVRFAGWIPLHAAVAGRHERVAQFRQALDVGEIGRAHV